MTYLPSPESTAFIYAQALDNSGDSEYLLCRSGSAIPERIDGADSRTRSVREVIDAVHAVASARRIGDGLLYRRQQGGAFVLTVKPVTLDVTGRISPVVVVFPDMRTFQQVGQKSLWAIQSVMGRQLAGQTCQDIFLLKKIFSMPLFLAWIILYFFSSKVEND